MSHHDHPSHVHHHFENEVQQFDSDKMGMWLFLVTEIMIFAGLFCVYVLYRTHNPEIFHYGHSFLDKNMGALNTLILLTSSLTMAWGVRAAQLSQKKTLLTMLGLTMILAFGFLVVKYFEYSAKFEHGTLYGDRYTWQSDHNGEYSSEGISMADAAQAAAEARKQEALAPPPVHDMATHEAGHPAQPGSTDSSLAMEVPKSNFAIAPEGPGGFVANEQELAKAESKGHKADFPQPAKAHLFFSIYFIMTGLHGIHVVIGIICIFIIFLYSARGAYNSTYYTPVDLVGLYWHLVDLIWIYLFPLLYLVD
jgi:cytochrome c oxidase subunit 3